MDTNLHCNTLACRNIVQDRAVVTTCCHIFCLRCADKLELSTGKDRHRKCPACHAVLNNPDDAVVAHLNPSEDYKTSVLSGLSPSTIMECAGRGINFWNYQMTQEILYQEYLARSLTDKYTSLSSHLDKTIAEANEEIKRLQAKLENVYGEHRKLDDKYRQLQVNHQERGKSMSQIQNLYRKLKQQQLSAGMELAAEHQAAEYISHGVGNTLPQDVANSRSVNHFLHSKGDSGEVRRGRPDWSINSRLAVDSTRHTNPNSNPTPLAGRTRLPMPQHHQHFPHITQHRSIPGESRTSYNVMQKASPSSRVPHGFRADKALDNLQGYGLSAGIKIGSPRLINPLSRRPSVGGGSIFAQRLNP